MKIKRASRNSVTLGSRVTHRCSLQVKSLLKAHTDIYTSTHMPTHKHSHCHTDCMGGLVVHYSSVFFLMYTQNTVLSLYKTYIKPNKWTNKPPYQYFVYPA